MMRMRMEREFVKESPWGICYFSFFSRSSYTLYGKLLPLVTIWSLNASYYRATFDFHASDQVHDHSHQHLFSSFFFFFLPASPSSSHLSLQEILTFRNAFPPFYFSFHCHLHFHLNVGSFLTLISTFLSFQLSRQTHVLMTNQWAGPCLLLSLKSADRRKCQPPPNFFLSLFSYFT